MMIRMAVWAAAVLAVAQSCATRQGCGRMAAAERPGSQAMIQYTVSLPAPQTQMVEMSMTVPGVEGPTLDVALPIRKVDKSTWRVTTQGRREVTVSYRVYANSLGDRTRHVDDTHAFLSPATVFMYVPERRGERLSVRVEAPKGWRVACGLEEGPGAPGTLVAESYDVLVDTPLEIGVHERIEFDVDGVPHEIIVWTGRPVATGAAAGVVQDPGRWIKDFGEIVRVQRDIFGDLPYRRFAFMLHLAGGAGGGTEHLNSFVAQGGPAVLEDDGPYRSFLALISHEMFHTWNVKQLRPADLHPYDYAHENYTTLLWLVEGTTSYYDDLCLVRTGVMDPGAYLSMLAGSIASEASRPGGAVQSLEASSFDAWITFNRPTPDAVNSSVSFYSKGSLVSLLLDLQLRGRTGNRVSLDDVLREMYRRFPLSGRGYTRADLEATLAELSGADFSGFMQGFVEGTAPLPFVDAVGAVGLELIFEPEHRADGGATGPYLGLSLVDKGGRAMVSAVLADGPAYLAGIMADDEIVAMDGRRLGAGDLAGRLKKRGSGDTARFTLLRRDRLREIDVTLAAKPAGSWTLRRVAEPTAPQKSAYESWLGQRWPGE